MKKIVYSLVLFVVFFGSVIPVKADPPEEDADWVCDHSGDTFYPSQTGTGCPSPNDPVSPYTDDGSIDFGGPIWIAHAHVDCSPYPDCIADMMVYYYVSAQVSWASQPVYGSTNVDFKVDVWMSGGASASSDWVDCGTGLSGSCEVEMQGVLPYTAMIRTDSTNQKTPDTIFDSFVVDYFVYYSLLPYSECDDEYTVLEEFSYVIDPLIEAPLGPAGAPPDNQIFPTVIGEIYRVELSGAGWDDGAEERMDAAISWDGETWEPLSSELCVGQGENGEPGVYYVPAESETFYIRANDDEGMFADNTQVDEEDPYTYTIGLAVPFTSCESQFMFDTEDDLISSVTVEADDEDGVQASNTTGFGALPPLVVQEWYAIVVTDGTWQDEGIPPERTDMEFQITHNTGFNLANYADLGNGGDGVWCQSTDETTWYVQARSTNLFLRVNNNEITGWGANTGALEVSIYAAEFERPLEVCEYDYEIFGSPHRDEVLGNAANGRSFAYVRADDDPFAGSQAGAGAGSDPFYVQSAAWNARPLEEGAWYILDTIQGPWLENTADWNVYSFDMAVNDGSGWIPLEEWEVPACNVALDALGHRRIYFQVPESPEGMEWFLRVNSSTFNNNGGYMAWNLYRATEVQFDNPAFNPWAGCLDDVVNSYDVIAFNSWIPVRDEAGTYINGNLSGGVGVNGQTTQQFTAQVLEVGGTYNVQIAAGPWDDDVNDASAADRFDAAVSSDNGVTWYAIDSETPGAQCLSVDQQGRYFMYQFTVTEGQLWKIRVNDATGEFGDNGGNLAYHLSRVRNLYGIVSGAGASNFCQAPLLRPTAPTSILDLSLWLNYVSEWVNYSGAVLRKFFAFCPQHVNAIMARMQAMRTKEPLASVDEASQTIDDVKQEVESFNWGNSGSGAHPTSLFGITNPNQLQDIWNRIFPKSNAARSPWEGGDIIDVSDFETGTWSATSSYNTCYTAFANELPVSIVQGVCFVSAAFRDTGASFWIQLSFDVSMIIGFVLVTKRPLQELIYMMTGVRPWSRSGAESGLNKLIGYLERRNDSVDREVQELENHFGGQFRFRRDRDGSFRRRG